MAMTPPHHRSVPSVPFSHGNLWSVSNKCSSLVIHRISLQAPSSPRGIFRADNDQLAYSCSFPHDERPAPAASTTGVCALRARQQDLLATEIGDHHQGCHRLRHEKLGLCCFFCARRPAPTIVLDLFSPKSALCSQTRSSLARRARGFCCHA